jgi:signal peptidase II
MAEGERRDRLRRGLLVASTVLVVDQATKWLVLAHFLPQPRTVAVAPFFNLVLAWNRGISFSLFHSEANYAPLVLSLLAVLIAAGLVLWLARAESHWLQIGIGLVVGGAIGNVIDRIRFGAVVDFLDFHLGGWHWPAFNIADSAITVGVLFLLTDGLFRRTERSTKAGGR